MVIVTDAVALEYVTPALLLILRVLKVIVALFPVGPVIVCADVPLKFTVLVPGVKTSPPEISRFPLMLSVPLPGESADLFPPVVMLPPTVMVPEVADKVVEEPPAASTKVIVPQFNDPAFTASV
jgi:hypothetical protein